jgi:hypothetical protein
MIMNDQVPDTKNIFYGFLVFFSVVGAAFVYVIHAV